MESREGSQLVPLDTLLTSEESIAQPGFRALVEGRTVVVTAVLERTVVYEVASGEPRYLARMHDCLVDPAEVRIRVSPGGPAVAARQAARRGVEASRRSQRKPAA
jgi:hypothetical protein